MNYQQSAEVIINELRGHSNIKDVVHCMTRLRFVLRDDARVSDKTVGSIPGVTGIVRQGGNIR